MAKLEEHNPANRVTVVDIDMPFGSMVVFMVKWAIATIPAFFILFVVGTIAVVMIGGLGAGIGAASAFRRAAPAADAVSTPTVAMRRVRFQANRDGDGWRIDNKTDVGWRHCVAESGISKASFSEITPYGAVMLRA